MRLTNGFSHSWRRRGGNGRNCQFFEDITDGECNSR
jgi:hypothetical protein